MDVILLNHECSWLRRSELLVILDYLVVKKLKSDLIEGRPVDG